MSLEMQLVTSYPVISQISDASCESGGLSRLPAITISFELNRTTEWPKRGFFKDPAFE